MSCNIVGCDYPATRTSLDCDDKDCFGYKKYMVCSYHLNEAFYICRKYRHTGQHPAHTYIMYNEYFEYNRYYGPSPFVRQVIIIILDENVALYVEKFGRIPGRVLL